ncbi:hypothetical protein [uncultured Dialister sp.]|uniref:hypothetical protein n=1 Tax=Dialister succinatiphilus TaxID=487173 RepID=UPI0026702339|nr:hypothetical protein [uncultured Dialister sp.]
MKKIDFELFGPGQYLYFDIGRLIQVENITKKGAGEIIKNQDLNLGTMTVLFSVGLRHHGLKPPQWYADKMQELLDQGHEVTEFMEPLVKALAGSGILGKAAYYTVFPEEATEEVKKEIKNKRKNG